MKVLKKLFNQKTEEEIVKEIHDSFNNAQEELLSEANELLETLAKNEIVTEESLENKVNQLKLLGFTQSHSVKQLNQIKALKQEQSSKITSTREQACLINHYKQEYPFQKFLTEDKLDEICKKYNLIYAPVKNYIKDIPQKNIDEMLAAKKLEYRLERNSSIKIISFYMDDTNEVKFIKKKFPNLVIDNAKIVSSGWSSYDYLRVNLEGDKGYIEAKVDKYEEIDRSGLFIAAPKSHFNLKDLKKTGKFGFLKSTIKVKKDPVVFRYCKGGIQVLTKWGLEASDPILLNEIEN